MFLSTILSVLIFVFALIVLAGEAWWFWYWHSFGDMSSEQILINEILVGIAIVLCILIFCFADPLLVIPVLFLPIAGCLIVSKIVESAENKTENTRQAVEIQHIEDNIPKKETPQEVYEMYMILGDKYFKNQAYEQALQHYNKAEEIADINQIISVPDLAQKIKQADIENKIKTGELWICSECSIQNGKDKKTCRNCGTHRYLYQSARTELKEQKRDIKKGILLILGIPVLIAIIVLIVRILPHGPSVFLSLMISLGVIYYLFRTFITW